MQLVILDQLILDDLVFLSIPTNWKAIRASAAGACFAIVLPPSSAKSMDTDIVCRLCLASKHSSRPCLNIFPRFLKAFIPMHKEFLAIASQA